jgi:hypothetical protein
MGSEGANFEAQHDELDAGLALCALCGDTAFSFKGPARRRPSRG